MQLYEYQGKDLLQSYGIPVLPGKTVEHVDDIQDDFPCPCVIKPQIVNGDPRKPEFIKIAKDFKEAQKWVKELLGTTLEGQTIQKLLVEKKSKIDKAYHLSIRVDRENRCPLLVFSPNGDKNIEDAPEKKIVFIKINPLIGLQHYQLRELPEIEKNERKKILPAITTLYRLFREKDCEFIEITLLTLTDGTLAAGDVQVTLDDNSLFRHSVPPLDKKLPPLEKEVTNKGIAFLHLEGTIGVVANGSALTMATLDALNEYGAKGGLFLDVGGTDDPEKVKQAFSLMAKAKPKVLLVNFFGGSTKCDTVAKGLLTIISSQGINCPVIARIKGLNEKQAKALLKDHVITATTLKDAAQKASELAG